jgi:RNA polymerase sigma-70 factor (ECF subfamily)
VFLSLFRNLQQGRSQRNLRAWTFRVAHNQALRRRNQERIGGQQQVDEGVSLEDLVPDTNPSPEDQAASNQRRQRVLAVVSALPEQDRRCLILRAEGLRYREIAEVLDISLYFAWDRFPFTGAVSYTFSACGSMVMYVVSRYSSD